MRSVKFDHIVTGTQRAFCRIRVTQGPAGPRSQARRAASRQRGAIAQPTNKTTLFVARSAVGARRPSGPIRAPKPDMAALSALYDVSGTAVVYLLVFGVPAALILETLARGPRRQPVAVKREERGNERRTSSNAVVATRRA